MFKKGLRDFLIMFGLVVLWASTSRTAMQYISDNRDGTKWWDTYPCKHGDLVSMSYLDFVKRFNPDPDTSIIRRPAYTGPGKTVLFLDGDSYTWYWHLKDTNFAGVCEFHYIDRYHGGYYHLDTTKRNVLLIEISERMFREYFSTTRMMDEVVDSAIRKKSIALTHGLSQGQMQYASFLPGLQFNDLFNKNINQNLQCNLFNYNFIIPMFEYKAALNYYLFNRASGDVVISKDRNFLFLRNTVSLTDISSSYGPLTADDITQFIEHLNTIYDHYKAAGFAEIYLSVIPNSATIMQPEGYNNLIPLIHNDPRFRMKTVDVFTAFRNSKEVLYHPGDTHWNKRGLMKWIATTNETLVRDEKH